MVTHCFVFMACISYFGISHSPYGPFCVCLTTSSPNSDIFPRHVSLLELVCSSRLDVLTTELRKRMSPSAKLETTSSKVNVKLLREERLDLAVYIFLAAALRVSLFM